MLQHWRRGALLALLAAPMAIGLIGSFTGVEASGEKASTRMLVDRAGREVRIPDAPKRIACLYGPSYEKLFLFGAADRASIVANVALPWCYKLNPGLKRIPVADNTSTPDVELLLRLKTDLVLYHPFAKQIEQLGAAGLPVAVPYDGSRRPKTIEGFLDDCYGQIRFYGEMLGGQARAVAQRYCDYVDERIRKVIAVTSKIPREKRPRVFYVSGRIDGGSNTQSRYSTAFWLVETAGGEMLTYDDNAYFVSVSTEQLISWSPDIIVVSTSPSIDPIVSDPRLQGIKAVKEKQVVISPEGLFYWSHFSSEWFLAALFMAKLFHPDLFADLDVKQELKSYYSSFYHYDLTDDEADRIMKHLPPVENEGDRS